MAKKGLNPEQAGRIVGFLNRRLERVHEGNQTRLARELGLSQPSLWQILNGETRPSYGTAEALATAEGVAVETLLAGPRERAAALAREVRTSETAIARVLGEPDDGVLRPVLYYVDRMRSYENLDSSPAAALPSSAKKAG